MIGSVGVACRRRAAQQRHERRFSPVPKAICNCGTWIARRRCHRIVDGIAAVGENVEMLRINNRTVADIGQN
jgi:hypothetical protein